MEPSTRRVTKKLQQRQRVTDRVTKQLQQLQLLVWKRSSCSRQQIHTD